jgi:hypothetical protein
MNELAITTISDLERIATVMSKSGLFNKSPDQMMALMLIAQAEGIHPAIAAQEYDVISGRPALKGQSALARFQQAGGSVQWHTRTDEEASATFTHKAGGSLKVLWTIERANRMGLTGKDNWKKQPGTMLSWRCVAEGVRAVYPACLNRMYLAEEIQDIEPMRDVTHDDGPSLAMPTEAVQMATEQSQPVQKTDKKIKPAKDEPVQEAQPQETTTKTWAVEWNERAVALSQKVAKWPKPDRDALELAVLVKESQQTPERMELAEQRAAYYADYRTTQAIDDVLSIIKDSGRDLAKLHMNMTAFANSITSEQAEPEQMF